MRRARAFGLALVLGVCRFAFDQTSADLDRVAAEKLFAEAEEMRFQYREDMSHKAIEAYEGAAQKWLSVSDKERAARAMQRIGAVRVELGDLKGALKSYREAERLAQEASSDAARSEILADVGIVSAWLGDDSQARDACNSALSLARYNNHTMGEARALNCLGEFSYVTGDLTSSIEYSLQAREQWVSLADRRGKAESALALGYAYSDSRDLDSARQYFREALQEWETLGDKRGRALTLVALGRLSRRIGENQNALNFYRDAMNLLAPGGDIVWQASIAQGIGSVYFQMNDYPMALLYQRQAIDLYRTAGLVTAEADLLQSVGEVLLASGDPESALANFKDALKLCLALGSSRCESWSLRSIGSAHQARGALDLALDHYQQALSKIPAGEDPRTEALTLGDIGDIHERKGDPDKAAESYTRAMTLSREAKDRFGEANWLYRLARLERNRDNLTDARMYLTDALEKVESLRAGVESKDLRSSYLASVYPYYQLYIDVLMSLDRDRPEEQLAAAAFQASEQARARAFLEMLTEAHVDIRKGVDADLLERERVLRESLDEKADQQVQLLSSGASAEQAQKIAEHIRQLTAEYDQVQAEIRSKSPRYAALTKPEPLNLQQVQSEVLDDDTVLLEYSLGERNSYLWAVSKSGYASHVLPAAAEIEKHAREVHHLLTSRLPSAGESMRDYRLRVRDADSRYWEEAGRLSEIVLGPVSEEIRGKRIAIVSDGVLQYVPFSALPVPGSSGGTDPIPLVAEHEIAWLPSASLLAVSRKETAGLEPAPKTVAVFADPVFESDDPRLTNPKKEPRPADPASDVTRALRDFGFGEGQAFRVPRLAGTLREADAILRLVPESERMEAVGFDASRSRAMSPDLRDYRILHFASHGLMDSDDPGLSGILLSMLDEKGQPQNGFLRIHDIYDLDLRAELVVLSACSTALGKELRGEGLVGLARAFMHSGAKRILASLWKVDDEATAELMTRFYQGMLAQGLSPAAALREAQVSMSRDKRWSAPFFWSAFSVQGDWR
jgi:CHAT domain-containing protein/tetratricopeptide (TPR) repeat protein